MAHVLPDLAKERQRSLLAEAAADRDAQRALTHDRIARRALRVERLQARRGDQVARLRAVLERLESAG
jgi:hypothetical protein